MKALFLLLGALAGGSLALGAEQGLETLTADHHEASTGRALRLSLKERSAPFGAPDYVGRTLYDAADTPIGIIAGLRPDPGGASFDLIINVGGKDVALSRKQVFFRGGTRLVTLKTALDVKNFPAETDLGPVHPGDQARAPSPVLSHPE